MKITDEQRGIFQDEVEVIASFLQSKMKQDSDGYYWDTIHYDNITGEFSYKFNDSIWNGTPGIILFFISLYAFSGEGDYLKVAKKATDKTLKMQDRQPSENTSLYDGIAGLIYVCVKLFEQTSDIAYLTRASALARAYKERMLMEREDDILAGKSGSLYALTLLYHHKQEEDLLAAIKALIQQLCATAKLEQQGIAWGEGKLSVGPLCGFSHGASGIAHVLLQVGNYFDEPDIIWLAEQALLYERAYYDPGINNWMDLRWTSKNDHLQRLFEWDNQTFMPTNFDANAWAHGAAGIGIARIYAFQITGNSYYNTEINAVLRRCSYDLEHQTKKSYLPFSGYSGLAEFFLLYSQLFHSEDALQSAITIGLKTVNQAKMNGHHTWGVQGREDLGLMTGTAGIGLLLLRLLGDPSGSILHPKLPVNKINHDNLWFPEPYPIRRFIYTRHFPQIIELLKNYGKFHANIFGAESIDEFAFLLEKEIIGLPKPEINYAKDLWKLEQLRKEMWKANKGMLCFQTRIDLLKAELDQFRDIEVLKYSKFIINPFVKVFDSPWNFKNVDGNLQEDDQHRMILYSSNDQVHEFAMRKFPALIVSHLEVPLTIEELADQLSEKIEWSDRSIFINAIILQLKELLVAYLVRGINL